MAHFPYLASISKHSYIIGWSYLEMLGDKNPNRPKKNILFLR